MKHFIIFISILLFNSCYSEIDYPVCWEVTLSYERKSNPNETDYSTTYFYGTKKELHENIKGWIELGNSISKEYNTHVRYKKATDCNCKF